jgi:hypothetical protein
MGEVIQLLRYRILALEDVAKLGAGTKVRVLSSSQWAGDDVLIGDVLTYVRSEWPASLLGGYIFTDADGCRHKLQSAAWRFEVVE